VTGATGTTLGTGSDNTSKIIASQGGKLTDYAACLARASGGGGYTDWFLPSLDELNRSFDSGGTERAGDASDTDFAIAP
jgi:hypothetical protein